MSGAEDVLRCRVQELEARVSKLEAGLTDVGCRVEEYDRTRAEVAQILFGVEAGEGDR